MKERFEIVEAGRVRATQLAPHLRVSDVIEVWRASGMKPLDALLDSIEISDDDMCWCATLRGHPVAMFGANDLGLDGDVGGIWLLASPAIYQNPYDFQRKVRRYLKKMHERYEYLTNFVDIENLPTQRWLTRIGFLPVQRVDEFGHAKTPFIQFVSKRKD